MPRARLIATRIATGALAVALAAMVIAWAPGGGPAHASVFLGVQPVTVSLGSVSPAAVGPRDTLTVTGTIRNAGTARLTGVHVSLFVSGRGVILSTHADLADWAAGAERLPLRLRDSVALTRALAGGAGAPFTLTVAAAGAGGLGFLDYPAAFGARGLAVVVTGDDGTGTRTLGSQRTFFVWQPSTRDYASTHLSVLAPLTTTQASADASVAGPVLSGELAPQGRLNRIIAATADTSVDWAIDPAILANAPRGLLDALVSARAKNRDVLSLPYADPDVAALVHARAEDVLSQALSLAAQTTQRYLGLALSTSLSWPADGVADSQTVAALATASAGQADVVLAESSVPPSTDPGYTLSARAAHSSSSGSGGYLLSNDALSAEVAATGGAQPALATQRLLADLAVITLERPLESRHLLATVPRGWDPNPQGVQTAITDLGAVPWVTLDPLHTLRALEPDTVHRERPTYSPQARAAELPSAQVAAAATTVRRALRFAPALTRRELVIPAVQRGVLSLVGQSWRSRPAGLAAARLPLELVVKRLYDGVYVLSGSSKSLLAKQARLPVTVKNTLDQAVRLVVRLRARNGRLQVGAAQTVEIEAGRTAQVGVPVRAIANGDVEVEATLSAPGGGVLVTAAPVEVHVHSDWEGRGLGIATALLGVLLALGVARSIRRGRVAVPPDSVPDPDDVGDEALLRRRRHAHAPGQPDEPAQPDEPQPPAPVAAQARPPVSLSAAFAPSPTTATAAAASATTATQGGQSLARNSALMASGTLVSRILGQVRASALGWAIGGALSADIFSTANTLPNSFYLLLAGGTLNAVLVPQIVRAGRRPNGAEYVDRLITVSLVFLFGATVLVTALAGPLFWLFNNAPRDQLALGTAFALWCMPQVFFYGLYTLFGQVLNARGSFGPFMWAPALANVVSIAGILVFVWVAGPGEKAVSWWTPGTIALISATATLGIVAQALILLPILRRSGFTWRFRWGLRGVGLRTASQVARWTFAAVAVGQLGFVVTSQVTTLGGRASLIGPGHVEIGRWVYDQAFLLFILPHSLVTVSLVTAVYPRMSHAAAVGRIDDIRADLSLSLRTTAIATILATAAFAVLGRDVTAVLFAGNPRQSTDAMAIVALAMTVGLVPFSAQYLFQRVFYAFEDARTPFFMQVVTVAVWTAGNLIAATLPGRWVTIGVGAAMTAGTVVGTALTVLVLRRRIGSLDGSRVLRTHVRIALAATAAAAAAWVTRALVHAAAGSGRAGALAALLLAGGVLVGVYAVGLRLLRVSELDDLLGPLLRPLRGARS